MGFWWPKDFASMVSAGIGLGSSAAQWEGNVTYSSVHGVAWTGLWAVATIGFGCGPPSCELEDDAVKRVARPSLERRTKLNRTH